MRTGGLVQALDALSRHRDDLRRTILVRDDVAALRLENGSRAAVIASPGDWYFSLDVDGGYVVFDLDREPSDVDVVAALRRSTSVALAYLDHGGVIDRPRRFGRPVLHVGVGGERVTLQHTRRESAVLHSDAGWEVLRRHDPAAPWPPAGAAETRCRVCGSDEGEERVDGAGSPQYAICSCCGAESGVDDFDVTVARRYRSRWVDRGGPWFTASQRPAGWTLARQLTQIPPEWR